MKGVFDTKPNSGYDDEITDRAIISRPNTAALLTYSSATGSSTASRSATAAVALISPQPA